MTPGGVSNPLAGAKLTVAETEVFSGTSPTAFTDLDLSAVVGTNPALVLLKVYSASNFVVLSVRKNGDTDTFSAGSQTAAGGCAMVDDFQTFHLVVLVATDVNGIIEWDTDGAVSMTIDVIAFIK